MFALFYVPAQNDFVPAGQVKAGDHLIFHDGELVQVEAVHSTDEVTTVYNLRVADHHIEVASNFRTTAGVGLIEQ